jgi:hypothetical protein
MPSIDTASVIKAQQRERMRNLRVGDFITLDAPPAPSVMVVNGKPMIMTPPRSEAEVEAERKAQADREWRDKVWRLYS